MSNRMWVETWDEMTARHDRERREALQSLSDGGYTQTEAAAIMKRSTPFINNYVQRYGIQWKKKQQGVKTNAQKS